jgi:hypothetical protein
MKILNAIGAVYSTKQYEEMLQAMSGEDTMVDTTMESENKVCLFLLFTFYYTLTFVDHFLTKVCPILIHSYIKILIILTFVDFLAIYSFNSC